MFLALLWSLPVRECGLKPDPATDAGESRTSLPVRECGLKQPRVQPRVGLRVSLPVRECGLKPPRAVSGEASVCVTPRAGVWIETFSACRHLGHAQGHSPCGSVD